MPKAAWRACRSTTSYSSLSPTPDATFIAGLRAWLKLGYCVRKGEMAVRIVAPMPIKPRHTQTSDADDKPRVLFKGVSVFDRSQVAPIDGIDQAPLEPPSEPLTGDSHAHLLKPLQTFTESWILTHETIHALGVDYQQYIRSEAEVMSTPRP